MKKYIKLASLSMLIAIGLTSCGADDDGYREDPSEIGGYATLSDRSISLFDRNSNLNINLFASEGATPQTVEILQDGAVIGDATVSGESASFNTSILGDFTFTDDDGEVQETGSYPIRIRTTYSNGKVSEDPFSVSVNKVVSLGNAADEYDNPTETTMDSLDAVNLAYEIFTLSATVDDVTLELKKNEDGTYMDSGVDVSTEGDYIELSETSYDELGLMVNDTLYYKFTATSGSLSDSVESMVAINPKPFTTSNSVTLSDDLTINQLNLGNGEITADGTEGGEIRFLDPTGFEVIDGADIDFVQVDDEAFFDDADVLNARAAYENGTPMTSFTNLENGDTFVYKTTRDVEDEDGNIETFNFYGVFRVGNVTVVDGTAVSFDIDYAEGY